MTSSVPSTARGVNVSRKNIKKRTTGTRRRGKGLIPVEQGSQAPRPGPVWCDPETRGTSVGRFRSRHRGLSKKAMSPPAAETPPQPPSCCGTALSSPGRDLLPDPGALPSSAQRARRYPGNAGRGGRHRCRQAVRPQSRTTAQPQSPREGPPGVCGAHPCSAGP